MELCQGVLAMLFNRILTFVFAILVFGFSYQTTQAQTSASISGSVTDPSGAPVAGAEVTAKSTETGWIRVTSTDTSGRYLILALPIGSHEIRVSAKGFKQMARTGIQLAVGQEARVDLQLVILEPVETVEVKGDVSVVNTSTADISGLVSE